MPRVTLNLRVDGAEALANVREVNACLAKLEAENERLREALRDLLVALAGRPDCTRLFGPHEQAIYERGRILVNAALSEQEGK